MGNAVAHIDELTTSNRLGPGGEHEARLQGTSTRSGVAGLSEGFSVASWRDADNAGFIEKWHRLALASATPNPFNEAWFLLPSLRQFDPTREVMLVTHVVRGELVGLMPMLRDRDYHGRPLPHLANWLHSNAFSGEPLVRADHCASFWQHMLDWCDRHAHGSLFFHLSGIPADGAALAALRDIAGKPDRGLRIVETIERAVLHSGRSPQDHLRLALDKKRRKELNRKRRRLGELGELVLTRHDDDTGLGSWIDQFLELEQAGWKGAQGSAISSAPNTEAVFRESLEAAARLGKLERLAFHLDGQPVAMLSSFICEPHAFGFKTTFDESLAKLSPGMLLQVENLAILERRGVTLSDSCAAPDHPMIGQIWPDRREIVKLSIPIGGSLRRGIGRALTALELRRGRNRK